MISNNRRLMLLLAGVLLAGFLATSLGSYYISKREIHDSLVLRELPLTSDNIYSEIQRDLLRPVFISSLMAQDTFVRDWALAGERDERRMVRYLAEIMQKYGTFTSFFISERSHRYYHPSGKYRTVTESNPEDGWYFHVRGMQPDYEINIDNDEANQNKMAIFINHRVFDYNKRFIGVTGVGLAVESVQGIIEDYRKRFQRNIFFVDAQGAVVLMGSGHEAAFTSIKEDAGYREIAPKILANQQGAFHYHRQGSTYLVNARYVPELNWYLLVEQAEDPALAALRRTLYTNLAVCLVVCLVVLAAIGFTVNRYQRRLEFMAATDKLTGLLNRTAFDVGYELAVRAADRAGKPLALLAIDLDHFKGINDQHGHIAGDRALEAAAAAMKSCLRASDVCCRWGGEEFLVLARECNGQQGLALAEKIRAAMAATFIEQNGVKVGLSASIGVAEFQKGESEDNFINRADEALYRAKERGRNRCILAGEPFN